MSEDYDVVAYADNNTALHGTFIYGCEVIGADKIKYFMPDKVVIAVLRYVPIGNILIELGFENVYVLKTVDNGFNVGRYELKRFENKHLYENCRYNQISTRIVQNRVTKNRRCKKVLMVSYAFPPEGGPAVQRILKFVKYLGDYGYQPFVLTSGDYGKIYKDESLEKEVPNGVEIIRIEEEQNFDWMTICNRSQELFDCFYFVSESKDFMRNRI